MGNPLSDGHVAGQDKNLRKQEHGAFLCDAARRKSSRLSLKILVEDGHTVAV
jgi:hypothetical protein